MPPRNRSGKTWQGCVTAGEKNAAEYYVPELRWVPAALEERLYVFALKRVPVHVYFLNKPYYVRTKCATQRRL
jgi:hypothetical protein